MKLDLKILAKVLSIKGSIGFPYFYEKTFNQIKILKLPKKYS